MTDSLKLSLPPWQLAYLRKKARERHVTMAEVIRDIVLKSKLEEEDDDN